MKPRLATVWFDHYSEPWETLPACDSVDIVREALQSQGFEHESWADKGNHGSHLAAIRAHMAALTEDWKNEPEKAKLPLVLYWSGHGSLDTEKDFYFIMPEHPEALLGWPASELARGLTVEDQAGRRDSSDAWRLVLLDTCHSVEAIGEILQKCGRTLPAQLVLLASGSREQPSGELARRFRRVMEDQAGESGEFTLREMVRRLVDDDYSRAQGSFAPGTKWPGKSADPIQATYRDLPELRALLKELPKTAQLHFLPKAQGTEYFTSPEAELSTPPWRFVGRSAERGEVGRWLRESSGLLAVTGRAGAGKSALLGMVLASTVPGLLDALREKGCDVTQPGANPPEGFSFDAILHLSGQTVQEFINSIVSALGLEPTERLEDMTARVAEKYPEGVRILSDALDEAVDPIPIISGLRQLAALPGAQVIVGTRRSLGERIDDPTRTGESLIERLTPEHIIVVERDEDAAYEYAFRALRESEKLTKDDASRCAQAISERDQPFLFTRLAVYELLADPEKAKPDRLESLLATGHGGIFAVSFERIRRKSRRTGAVVRSLAYSFGRGFPRTDGIWQKAANAIYEPESTGFGPDQITDSDIGAALDEAGAYIMIDFEHGQSVFRLAHRTFREYFEDLDAREQGG